MGMCRECLLVFNDTVLKNGCCPTCFPKQSERKEKNTITNEDNKIDPKNINIVEDNISIENKKTSENNTCGIVSFVLSIVSLFTGGIGLILAVISLICGISNSKDTLGMLGMIISGIYLLLAIFGMIAIFH